jgi:hypothetical protein
MSTFFAAAGLLTVVALGTVLTGRILGGFLGVPLLRRFTPEGAAASAATGTAFWALVSGWCSYAGLAAPASLVIIALVVAVAAASLLAVRRHPWLRPQGGVCAWAAWLGILAMAAVLTLLPLALHQFFNPCNDTLNYCTIAEVLQDRGVGLTPPSEPAEPAADSISLFHQCHVENWRLGAMYLLALVQAFVPGSTALEVFPVVMAWGVLLNVGSVYCLVRWAWRLPRGLALLAPILLVDRINPLLYSAHYGFLSQVYGTATLTFALALLGRLRPRSRRRWAMGALLGLVVASMLSLYSEMAPVLVIAVAAHLIWQVMRKQHETSRQAWLRLSAFTLVVVAILANVEMLRAVRALQVQTQAITGTPKDGSALRYWSFALGCTRFDAPPQTRWHAITVATACVLLGLLLVLRRRQLGLGSSFAVLAALAVFFHWFVRDPWTGELGHSWSQFKLCKWAYPLLVSAQAGGAAWLLRRLPRAAVLVFVAGVFMLTGSWKHQVRLSDDGDTYGRQLLLCDRPLAELRALRQQRAGLPGRPVRVIHDNDGPLWPHGLAKYLLFGEPCLIPERTSTEASQGYVAGVDYIMLGCPPFEEPMERLPCGVCRLDASRPLVFAAVYSPAAEGLPQRAVLSVWSPDERQVILAWKLVPETPDPAAQGTLALDVTDARGHTQRWSGAGGAAPAGRIMLPPGVSRVQLAWPGARQRLTAVQLSPAPPVLVGAGLCRP